MGEMVPFKLLISREEALKTVLNLVKPIDRTEQVSLEETSNRVLAEDIIADEDVPPFHRAAMDGYAVRAEDTYGASDLNPITLKLIGVLHAGGSTDTPVNKGECIRIATGCQIPPGADAVVMVEFTEEKGGGVSIYKAVYPVANIAQKGEDIKKGEVILKDGDFLTPAKIGALAALGRTKALVYQKPRVAVIPTGIEVCEIGSELKEGQVYDVNSYFIVHFVR
jgi:molybdopterin biosynthesis enzyme